MGKCFLIIFFYCNLNRGKPKYIAKNLGENMTKFRWGLIGGGRGSQIGPAHRLGATVDGNFEFVASALDLNADEGRRFALELGLKKTEPTGIGKKC